MKKVSFLVALAVAAGMASCTAQSPKGNLKTDADSLAYAVGMAQTQGIEQLYAQHGIDSTNMVAFLKGVQEGAKMTEDDDAIRAAGIYWGMIVGKHWTKNLNMEVYGNDSVMTIDSEKVVAGFLDGIMKNDGKMNVSIAAGIAQTKKKEIKEKVILEKYGDYKKECEDFLAANKEKEGVVTLPSGLQYKVLTAGTGAIPEKTDKVKVNYKGTLIDGTEFDSSYKHKDKDGNVKPAEFRADRVIKGWTEALTLMPVGSKWELYIPQELAYGSREGNGAIKPFSTLVFEVELIDIVKAEKKK